jgi:hypothetical protein
MQRAVEKKLREAADQAASGGATTGSASGENDDDGKDPADAKMHAYIECFNGVNGRAHDSMNYYARWIKDPKKGPTGKETSVYGPHELSESDVKKCADLGTWAKKTPALGTLDDAATRYSSVITSLAPKLTEAHKYYDRKDYKDDKFAKGIAMHGPLWSAFEAFDKVSDEFSDGIDKHNAVRLDAEIRRVEATQGKKLYWHKAMAGRKSRELLHLMEKDTFDAKEAERLVTDFTSHVDATLTYAKSNQKEQPIMWSMYESALKEFLDAAKERMRRVRDKTPHSSSDQTLINMGMGWQVSGSASKMSRKYNDMVTRGNGMRFPI